MRLAIIAALALSGCAGIKHVPEPEGNPHPVIVRDDPCCLPVVPDEQPSFPPIDGLPKDLDQQY
jgi:hypothetical protein